MSYEIRPLEWSVFMSKWLQEFRAEAVGGECVIQYSKTATANGFNPWRWGFHPHGCDCIKWAECDSLEHGKQLAEAEYRRRLLPMLIEVKEATD